MTNQRLETAMAGHRLKGRKPRAYSCIIRDYKVNGLGIGDIQRQYPVQRLDVIQGIDDQNGKG